MSVLGLKSPVLTRSGVLVVGEQPSVKEPESWQGAGLQAGRRRLL